MGQRPTLKNFCSIPKKKPNKTKSGTLSNVPDKHSKQHEDTKKLTLNGLLWHQYLLSTVNYLARL